MTIVDNSAFEDNEFDFSMAMPAEAFPSLTGREMWDIESISTLNKLPVTLLSNFILAGVDFDEKLPIDIKMLSTDLLIDGSIALIQKNHADVENSELVDVGEDFFRFNNINIINENLFLEQIPKKKSIIREYSLGASIWLIRDFKNYGKKNQMQVNESTTLPAESILVIVNGEGILQPYNQTYQRLEEIETTLRNQTTRAMLSTIVGGASGNRAGVKKAVRAGHQLLLFPNSKITVARVGDSSATDQLLSMQDSLMKRYFKAMNIIDVEASATLSGISRRLAMIPTINSVQFNRKLILRIYKQLGYTGVITFAPISLMDAKEKILELEFLHSIKAAIDMKQSEFIKRATALLN